MPVLPPGRVFFTVERVFYSWQMLIILGANSFHMKPLFTLTAILMALVSLAQDAILAANKCYDERNYECAVGKYMEALADKKYQEKDFATIKYRIGVGLKEQGKMSEAIPHLKEAIASKENYGEAYWTLGWCYYSTKDYTLAADNYTKAMPSYQADKKSLAILYYGRGTSLIKNFEDEDALEDFREAILLDSTVSNHYSYAGEASYNLGEYRDAIMYYSLAIQKGKNEPKPTAARYYWVGEGHLQLKEYNQALDAFAKGLAFNPDNSSIHWGIAATYFNQQKWTDAVTAYTRAIGLLKDDTASLKSLYYWRGRTYTGMKDYVKAQADYEAALQIDPRYRDAFRQRTHSYYNLKKYKEAIPLFTSTIAMFSNDNQALDDLYFFRGACHFQLKDTMSAEKDFKSSLSYNSNLLDPNVYMGHINSARRMYAEARTYYNKGAEGFVADSSEMSRIWMRKGISNLLAADVYTYTAKEDLLRSLKYDSLNKEAHRHLADAYYRQANYISAEKELDKCIELYKKVKDSIGRMYLYRGQVRSQQKKYKEALADYDMSEKSTPFTQPADIVVTGQLAFEVKDYEKASRIFSRVIPLYKPDQKNELLFAYFGRGRAALELKKKDQAVKDLKKALEYSPANKDVESWLAKAEALP